MRDQAPQATVRPLAGATREFVVEVTSPIARNALYRAYQGLFAIGVQVLHTSLRMKGGEVVQTLHLAEFDDARLAPRRVLQALTALKRACEAPGPHRAVSGQQAGALLGQ